MENLLVNLIDCRTADNSAAEYTCHMHTKQAQTHGRVGLLVAINNISMQNKSRWLCFGAYNRWMWNIFVTLLMEALKKMFGDFRRCPVFIFLTHFFSISSWLQEREKKKQPINFMINRHLRHHQKMSGEWTVPRENEGNAMVIYVSVPKKIVQASRWLVKSRHYDVIAGRFGDSLACLPAWPHRTTW